MVRVNDEKELAKRYDEVHVDTKSSQVIDDLSERTLNFLIIELKMCLPRNISNNHSIFISSGFI